MALLSVPRCLLLLHLCVLAWCQPLPPPTALDTSVAVGEMAELVCSVMGYSGSVPVSVSIMKMSDPRSLSNQVTSEGMTATLYIEAAHLDDSGMYRCTAFTTTGETMTEAVFFNFEVRNELALIMPIANATVTPGSNATFSCIFNMQIVVTWLRLGENSPLTQSSKYLLSGVGERVLTIIDVTYSDMGRYACQVNINSGRVTYPATLGLSPAYIPLRRIGQTGQSTIATEDQLRVDCRDYITGVPGANLIYWQRDIVVNPTNVSSREGSNNPFVDEESRLDLSDAGVDDEGRYRCIAVDEQGERVELEFFIRVTHVSGFFLWDQWYMIVVYCVVGVAILAVIVLAIWFGFSVKFNFCFKAEKVVKEKHRVRRSEHNLVYKIPVRDDGIDAYALAEKQAETYDEEEDDDEGTTGTT